MKWYVKEGLFSLVTLITFSLIFLVGEPTFFKYFIWLIAITALYFGTHKEMVLKMKENLKQAEEEEKNKDNN